MNVNVKVCFWSLRNFALYYQVYLDVVFPYLIFILTVLLAVCKPFSLGIWGKAHHVLVKKKMLCLSSGVGGGALWFLDLGKWVMLPHSQAEFPMATESRIAGNQFNS